MSASSTRDAYERRSYRPSLNPEGSGRDGGRPVPPLLVESLKFDSITAIPPRPWAYGHFLLFGCASAIGAVDGGGKGAIAVATALAIITGKPLLHERVWRTGPVVIVSYEDDKVEWQRRIAAACLHYGIDHAQASANIHFVTRPDDRVSFGRLIDNGGVAFPDSADIMVEIQRIGAVLMIVDPFNHAHDLPDGNNNAMVAKVAGEVSRIARECGVAVLVLHHLRKGADGSPDDLMGATSLRATFRSSRILAGMDANTAKAMHITDRWRYIRISGSKENYAPPPERSTWFRLESVPLANATGQYPEGDDVAVATTWQPRPMFEGMDNVTLEAVFRALDCEVYSPNKQAKKTPWAGKPLMEIGGRTQREAAAIIAAWLDRGVLTKGEYYHAESRHKVERVVLNTEKAAEITAGLDAINRHVD